MSGAGRIKWDGSDQEHLVEVKDANYVYGMRAGLLASLRHEAIQQGKEPILIVRYANGIEAEVHIRLRRTT